MDTFVLLLAAISTGALLLIAAQFWMFHGKHLAGRLGIAYTLSTCFIIACITTHPHGGFGFLPAIGFYAVICSTNSWFLWMFGWAVIDDSFRIKAWHFVPLATVVLPSSFQASIQALDLPDLAASVNFLLYANVIAMYAHIAFVAYIALHDELIESRLRFRRIFIGPAALLGFVHYVTMYLITDAVLIQWLHIGVIIGTALCIAFLSLWLFGPMRGQGLFNRGASVITGANQRPAAPAQSFTERRLVSLLSSKMENDRFYREQGLTIGRLADAMDLPTHRLRRLINTQLGYRNFSAFLNKYRIEEACKILADEDASDTQVLTLAMDLGYQSLSPFHKAFKAATGVSPTDYRRQVLG